MPVQGETAESSGKRGNGFRNVLALGLVSFFTDVSSEMCFGILPLFILELKGATTAFLGLIEGLAEALSYTLRMVSGVMSDRLGRKKPLVFVGYALSTIAKPLFSVAQTWTDALTVRVSDRVGKAVRTSPRDALLSESVAGKHMGKAFGLHRTLDQTGAIVGPVLASALMIFLAMTMRDIFLISIIPGLIALVVLIFFVREKFGKRSEAKLLEDMKRVLRGKFLILLFIVGLFSIGAFNFSFVLVRAKELGVSDEMAPIVYSVINIVHAAIAIPAGILSDRIGKEKVLMMGYGMFLASTLLIFASPQTQIFAFLIAVVYGGYMGIVETVQRAIIPAYAPNGLRGTAYGLYYLTVGMCFLVSNGVVGALWYYVGAQAAAAYSMITAAVSIMAMMAFGFLGHKAFNQSV